MRNIVRLGIAAFVLTIVCSALPAFAATCEEGDSSDENLAVCTKALETATTATAKALAYRNRAFANKYEAFEKWYPDMSEAIGLSEKNATLYADLSELYPDDGAWKTDKIENLSRAIELDAKNAEYYSRRAALYDSDDGSTDSEMLSDLSKAIELNPKSVDAYRVRARYYMEHDDEKAALADLRAMDALGMSPFDSAYAFGQLYTRMGDTEAAIKSLTEATLLLEKAKEKKGDTKPSLNDALVYGTRGLNYLNAGKTALAIDDLTRAIAGFDHRVLRELRGSAFMASKKYLLGVEDFTKCIQLEPKHLVAYVLRAQAYDALGRKKEAAMDRADAAFIGAELMKPRKKYTGRK